MVGKVQLCRIAVALLVGLSIAPHDARAGNEANFVLYDHHTDPQGTTETNVWSDLSNGAPGEPRYSAQLLEMERAITDRWTAALYLEGDEIDGEGYGFGGWRLENRYRLFAYDTWLNPVLYVEYADLHAVHRYLLEAVGRTNTTRTDAGSEVESRLILGKDINDRLDIAFNWINDVSLGSGDWEFGYALGLNYALLESDGGRRRRTQQRGDWRIKEIKLGAELFGGLGDTALGLSLDPNVTQQYAELNLRSEFDNGMHVQLGGAVGLTAASEPGLFRVMVGYEFK